MTEPQVLVIGAASIDVKGRAKRPLISKTSNPGKIHSSCGGEGRNIAENLARLGLPVRLLSAVGRDSSGATLLEETARAGVDTSRIIISPEYESAAYLAVLDESGNLSVSIDDMQVLRLLQPNYIHRNRGWFKDIAMLVLDTNMPQRTIESALRVAEHYKVPVSMNAVAVTLAHRMRPFLGRLALVAANLAEAAAILNKPLQDYHDARAAAKEMVSKGVDTAIVTLGENGLCYATPGESGYIEAISCDIVDNTGAGAALMAAILYGLLNGLPSDEAMRLGVSAATLTLKSPDTVCKELSLDLLYDQLVI